MYSYYLNTNAQASGEYEIHKYGCKYCGNTYNFAFLGHFSNDKDALLFAKRCYPQFKIDGCAYCCNSIHKE